MDYLPLPDAAALAYQALAGVPHEGMPRSVIAGAATALATCTPLYAGEPPRRLSDEEVWSSARLPLEQLYVERWALDRAIERLRRAGISFSAVKLQPA